MVTADSEQRLGQTLLQLARTMGKKDPRSIRIELKISHEEFVRDGWHDPTKDQSVYAALSQPWADRDQSRALS
jgi:hypothetical protein